MTRESDPRYQQMILAGYHPDQILSCPLLVGVMPGTGWHLCCCQVVDCQAGAPMPPASECGLG